MALPTLSSPRYASHTQVISPAPAAAWTCSLAETAPCWPAALWSRRRCRWVLGACCTVCQMQAGFHLRSCAGCSFLAALAIADKRACCCSCQVLEGTIRAALVTPDLRHAGAFHATFLVVGGAAGPVCAGCSWLCVGSVACGLVESHLPHLDNHQPSCLTRSLPAVPALHLCRCPTCRTPPTTWATCSARAGCPAATRSTLGETLCWAVQSASPARLQ